MYTGSSNSNSVPRYSQVRWRDVSPADEPEADPAVLRPDEQMAACVLDLRGPEYLPLRTWTDRDLGDDERGQSGDPILAVLAAVRQVPPRWRALAQLLLLPAPADWSSKYSLAWRTPGDPPEVKRATPACGPCT